MLEPTTFKTPDQAAKWFEILKEEAEEAGCTPNLEGGVRVIKGEDLIKIAKMNEKVEGTNLKKAKLLKEITAR
jgi:hypothetical protein